MRSKTFKEVLEETPKEVEDKVREYAKAMMEEPKELNKPITAQRVAQIIRLGSNGDNTMDVLVVSEMVGAIVGDLKRYYEAELEKQKEHYLKMVEEEAGLAFSQGRSMPLSRIEYMKALKERIK